MIKPENLYTEYVTGNKILYPANIFEVKDLKLLKQQIDQNEKNQLFYKGVFSNRVLSVLGKYLLQIVDNGSLISEKLFKIFVELAQNISFYSAEKNKVGSREGVGIIHLTKIGNSYYMSTGNIINKVDADIITEKLHLIDTLDRHGLRDLKRKQRHLQRGNKGTANVGLIQVALTSENPMYFDMKKITEEISFYSLLVTVNTTK